MNFNDNDAYHVKIMDYCNRIIREKRLDVYETNNGSNIMFSIKFCQPEWFLELDDDLQYNIMVNLQSYYKGVLSKYLGDDYQDVVNNSKKRKLEE
jgi:hypothetical protein